MESQRRFTRRALTPWAHGCKVLLCEAVPINWSEAVHLFLFEKRDKTIYSYYRGISLIDVTAKVYGVILLNDSNPKGTSPLFLTKVA